MANKKEPPVYNVYVIDSFIRRHASKVGAVLFPASILACLVACLVLTLLPGS